MPLYEAYSATLLALNRVPTLQQRVGNRAWQDGDAFIAQDGTGFWSRLEAHGAKPGTRVSTSGTNTDLNVWRLQLGMDRELRRGDKQGLLVGGLTASLSRARNEVASVYGQGSIRTQGTSLGATLTWYGPRGFYVDTQVQLSHYRSDLRSNELGDLTRDHDGRGTSLSVELGERFPVSARLTLTPQFQTVYSKVDFDDFRDPAGAKVSQGQSDSLVSRWGVALDYDKAGERGRHLYAIANVSYDWRHGTRVDVSGTPLFREQSRLWGELGAGGTYSWKQGRHAVYFEASGQRTLQSPGRTAFNATLGYRSSW